MKTLKKTKSFHNKHLYNIEVTDILKFYFEVLFKTVTTIGNEKEQ